jgi:hypothetical protein
MINKWGKERMVWRSIGWTNKKKEGMDMSDRAICVDNWIEKEEREL